MDGPYFCSVWSSTAVLKQNKALNVWVATPHKSKESVHRRGCSCAPLRDLSLSAMANLRPRSLRIPLSEWESPGIWCGWQSPSLRSASRVPQVSARLRWPPRRRSSAKPTGQVLFSHLTRVTWPSGENQWSCRPCLFMRWENIPTAGLGQLSKHLQCPPLVRISLLQFHRGILW